MQNPTREPRGDESMEEDLRTYVYYSDKKISELAPGLSLGPKWLRPFRNIRKVEVKGGPAGAAVELAPPSREMLRTMREVQQRLQAKGSVGTFAEPKRFFHGVLDFYYGIFNNVSPPVFFLVGETDRTIVALGGSADHTVGHRTRQVDAVANAKNVTMEPDVAKEIYTDPDIEALEVSTPEAARNLWATHVAAMSKNWRFWNGNMMEFEVLAVKHKFIQGYSAPPLESPRDILIGSPIFVAQPPE
jgi:hypothetical protein